MTRALSLLAVLVAAAASGVVTVLAIGVGCFHCGPSALPMILGAGLVAAAGVGAAGFTARRRLLDRATSRWNAVAVLAGLGAAIPLFLAPWLALFDERDTDAQEQAHATPELALPAAMDAGRPAWPGTTLTTRVLDHQTIEVQRRWLGVPESYLTLHRTDGRWSVAGPTTDAGWFAQVVLACVLPSTAGGVGVLVLVRRRFNE